MNAADLLDELASVRGLLSQLAETDASLVHNPVYTEACRGLTRAIKYLVGDTQEYMTPSEVRSFNQNLKNMREGGT